MNVGTVFLFAGLFSNKLVPHSQVGYSLPEPNRPTSRIANFQGRTFEQTSGEPLAASQVGWHEGHDDPIPFVKYLLGTILAAYKDFADRFAIVETKRSALDMVRMASQNKIGRFTKQYIREQCPSLSISSIESALRNMVVLGEIKREGAGKNTVITG